LSRCCLLVNQSDSKKKGSAYSKWGRCLNYLYPKRFCTIDFLQPDPGCPCDEESKKRAWMRFRLTVGLVWRCHWRAGELAGMLGPRAGRVTPPHCPGMGSMYRSLFCFPSITQPLKLKLGVGVLLFHRTCLVVKLDFPWLSKGMSFAEDYSAQMIK
jgi:hypothetical protein